MMFCRGPALHHQADLENTGIVAGEVNCRQIAVWGEFYEKPLCPVIMDNGERWYWWCDVPHCVESVYESNPLGLSNTDYNWGLERILSCVTPAPLFLAVICAAMAAPRRPAASWLS